MINIRRLSLRPFLFRSLFAIATSLKGQTPLYDYQQFSKKIQNASGLPEVINIYKDYSAQDQSNVQRYLATTMRIMSRLINQKDNKHLQTLKMFLNLTKGQLDSLNPKEVEVQNLKYFLVFFHTACKSESMLKIVAQNSKMVENCLKELNRRFKTFNSHQQQQFASTLLYCIKIAHTFCPHLQPAIIDTTIALLYAQSDSLVTDSFSFSNLFYTLRSIFDPGNSHHLKLVHTVFFFVSLQDYLKLYEEYSLVNILITILAVQKKMTVQSPAATINLLDDIGKAIENKLLQDMKKLSQRTHSFMVESLLDLKIDHKLLREYFNTIEQVIDHQGRAKVNPRVILYAVSLLTREDMVKYLSGDWEGRFLKMLELYFSPSQVFKAVSSLDVLTILQKQTLSPANGAKLYKFYFWEWKAYNRQIVTQFDYMKKKMDRVHALYQHKQE